MPTELLPMPVQAQVAHDHAQPGGEARWPFRAKLSKLVEPVAAQVLADKKEAVRDGVFFMLEEPDNLMNKRGEKVQKPGPSLFWLVRTELAEKRFCLLFVHGRHLSPFLRGQ